MYRFTLVCSFFAILVATNGQSQTTRSGCAMPQEAAYRTFKAYDRLDQLVDGGRVPGGGYVHLQCANGYLFPDGSNTSTSNCRPTPKGEWHPPPEPCKRICPLPESSNVDFTCKYNGREIGCDDTPLFSGTEIRPQCKFLHRLSPAFNVDYTTMRCTDDGTWNRKLFKCDPVCGVSKHDPLIENGLNSTLGQFPWHVAIYSVPRGDRLICGGTLIAPNIVVSAAHCFYNESFGYRLTTPADYAIVVGKLSSNFTKIDHSAQKRLAISEILFAEKPYRPETTGYSGDIALIVLEQPITISSYVLPACFRNHERVGFNPGPGVNGTLCGWGLDETGLPAETLKTTQLPFIHYNQCADKLPGLTFDKFCAGSDHGPRARPGDSGGGLVFKDSSNFFYVRGIVSTSQRFSTLSIASFTDISYYQDWIDKVIQEKSGRYILGSVEYLISHHMYHSGKSYFCVGNVVGVSNIGNAISLNIPTATPVDVISSRIIPLISFETEHVTPSITPTAEPDPPETNKYRGCYEVSARSSLLNDRALRLSTEQTLDSCINFCQKSNFPFAGIQRRECRCGRHVPSDLLKRSYRECNFTCPGSEHDGFKCGGKSKVSVYNTEVQIGANAIPTRIYLGCVKDDKENFRVLNGSRNLFASENSPKKCHSTCFETGFKYFGLTYEKECFCGDTIPAASDNLPESECSSRCSGDPEELLCGGVWRLSLYATGITDYPEVSRLVGCMKTSEFKAQFKFDLPKSNTNRRCLNMCSFKGYKYSAVENRAQCSCTNSAPDQLSLDADPLNCDKQECLGDPTEKCGAIDRVKIYRTRHADTISDNEIRPLGCFEDRIDYRLLDAHQVSSIDVELSPRLCADICKKKGFAFSGLEAGKECFCDHEYPPPSSKLAAEDCNVPCEKNANEKCGGVSKISVYETGLPRDYAPVSRVYMGCYEDDVDTDRLLKGSWQKLKNNSPDVCHRLCLKTGFRYFGLKLYEECSCGDEDPSSAQKFYDYQCNRRCCGDSNKKCGGKWKTSIYKTGLEKIPDPSEPLGCFHGDGSFLNAYSVLLSTSNTPKRCFRICDQMGYMYAGVQAGDVCRCGNDLSKSLRDEDASCDEKKCSGSDSETCGGSHHVKVYLTTVQDRI